MDESEKQLTLNRNEILSPMQMIQEAFQSAIASGAGLEVVDRILAQQREMMEYQDKVAFQAALRRIQDDIKPIIKDCENRETKSRYSSSEAIDEALEKLLARERMTLSFEPKASDKPDMVFIVGVLSLGAYSKEYPLEMPADGKGAKGGGVMSRTHATGSAITYAKRYLKNMIFNLRFREKDDDGNRAGGKQSGSLDEQVFIVLQDSILSANSEEELKKFYFSAISKAEAIGDKTSIQTFERAKKECWARLKEEGKR